MIAIKLRLLGAPRTERDGATVAIATRKPLALLAYLALTDAPVTRERLMLLLWPEADAEHAQGDLRRALTTLRQALGNDVLLSNRQTVALRSAAIWTDVAAFRALTSASGTGAAAESQLEEAVALWRDDFMAGFALRDSAEFDGWQLREGERLRNELAAALQRLVELHADARNFARASVHARRWLDLDPLREDAHRALMRLYAQSGRRADAIRQYQECERVLADELGVQPLEETTALFHRIKDRVEPARMQPAASSHAAVHPSAGHLPLIGRERELAAMVSAADAPREHGYWIALEGEAGIGKTRLLDEFAQYMAAADRRVLRTRCYDGESGLGYEPVAQLLRSAFQHEDRTQLSIALAPHWRAELARILPEFAATSADVPSADSSARARLFEAVRQTLFALCAGKPLALVFDDLQWADQSTLELLVYLLRRGVGARIGFVTAWRSEDNDNTAQLRRLLADVLREGHALHVTPERLSAEQVARLCNAGAGETQADAARLFIESEGVPLLVVEYLRALAQSQEAGWALPTQVRSLMRARAASLDPLQRQVLQSAAAIGRSFNTGLVQRASGRSDEEVANALEELGARGLIRTAPTSAGQDFDFAHDKLREVVYDDTHLARRRLLHERIGQLIRSEMGSKRTGESAGKAARHFVLAEKLEIAALCYAEAGDYARRAAANTEALAMYRAALELGHRDPAQLREAIGDLLALRGDYARAIETYRAAGADADAALAARITHALANAHARLGEWSEAKAHFELAERGATLDAQRAHVISDWSRMALAQGDVEQARLLSLRAFALADDAGDARALARARNMLGVLARHDGDDAQASAQFQQCLTLARQLGDRTIESAVLNNLALTERNAGNDDAALALAGQALQLCVAYGDRHGEAALRSNLADMLRARGRRDEAMEQLTQSAVIFSEIGVDPTGFRPEVWKLIEW